MILRFFILFIFIINCSFQKIDYNKRICQLVANYEKYIKENYKLEVITAGTGTNHEDIYRCDFVFAKYDHVPYKEAMVTFYDLEDSFLKYINSEVALKPYLHNYPFTYNDVEFAFTYFTTHEDMPPQTFETISHKKDTVVISVFNKLTQERKTLYRAKYKEFLEDVNQIKKYLSI
jgi:hypothetical protein